MERTAGGGPGPPRRLSQNTAAPFISWRLRGRKAGPRGHRAQQLLEDAVPQEMGPPNRGRAGGFREITAGPGRSFRDRNPRRARLPAARVPLAVSNQRTDSKGSLRTAAVCWCRWPGPCGQLARTPPLFVRISATGWIEAGGHRAEHRVAHMVVRWGSISSTSRPAACH